VQQAGLFCPAEPDHIGPMASSKPSHSEQSPSRTSSADSRRAPAQENASSLSGPSDSLVMVPQSEDYEIQEPAGRDTNGTVWKALDRVGQRTVALKRIRPELAESRELIARIRRDVKTFAGFQHPGIVQVFDLKKDDDGLFLVLEWVDGWNLTETMQTSGPLEELRAVKGIARVADALQAAHEQKITHRNIKPANILLAPHGKLKLTDFGLVRVDVESLADSLEVTDFVAPELVVNPRDVSVQSDIWSLAATLYQLLTGWSVREFEETLLPATLRDTLLCALADDPAARFGDADRFAAALRGDRSEFKSRKPETPKLLTVKPTVSAVSPTVAGSTVSISRPASTARSASATPTQASSRTRASTTVETPNDVQPSAKTEPSPKRRPSEPTQPATRRATKQQSTTTTESAEAGSSPGRVTKLRRPIITPQPDEGSTTTNRTPARTDQSTPAQEQLAVSSPAGLQQRAEVSADGDSKPQGSVPRGAQSEQKVADQSPGPAPPSTAGRGASNDESSAEAPVTRRETTTRDAAANATSTDNSAPRSSQPATSESSPSSAPPSRSDPKSEPAAAASSPQAARVEQPTSSLSGRVSFGGGGEQATGESVDASEVEDDHEGRSQQTKTTSQTLIVAWVVGLAFVLAIVIFIDSDRAKRANENRLTTGNSGMQDTGPPPVPTAEVDDFAGHEISVGPLGQFKSIQPCLDYLKRNAHRYAGNSRRQNVQLLVSGGKTYGPLVLDNSYGEYPHGIHIIAQGDTRPVLSAPGEIPVRLQNVRSFRLEGFDVDTSEDDVAIQISGLVPSTRLVDLHVSGFKECGLQLNDVVGDVADELVIESVHFESGSANAVGIRISGSDEVTPTRTKILNCRMTGPQQAGIVLDGGGSFVELRENIIDQADVGLRFSGESVDWIDLLIANTTFYKCGRAGVVFDHPPATGGLRGTQLTFYRNLFAKGGGPEVLFETGIEPDRFNDLISTISGSGIRENWSDRQSPADPAAGEAEIVDIDSTRTESRRVESVEFRSTDRNRSDFLMLKRKSPLGSVGVPRLGTRSWIGARPPFK